MIPSKNLPLLLNLTYCGYNRALPNSNGSFGDFQPRFDEAGNLETSFCNQFIQYICNGLGYNSFNGMNANEMHEFMINPQNGWIVVDDQVAQNHANNGVLVLASHSYSEHGHICLILPGILERSMSYQKSVPKCANVGKDVFFGKRVSFAFKEIPTYFCLGAMV